MFPESFNCVEDAETFRRTNPPSLSVAVDLPLNDTVRPGSAWPPLVAVTRPASDIAETLTGLSCADIAGAGASGADRPQAPASAPRHSRTATATRRAPTMIGCLAAAVKIGERWTGTED